MQLQSVFVLALLSAFSVQSLDGTTRQTHVFWMDLGPHHVQAAHHPPIARPRLLPLWHFQQVHPRPWASQQTVLPPPRSAVKRYMLAPKPQDLLLPVERPEKCERIVACSALLANRPWVRYFQIATVLRPCSFGKTDGCYTSHR